MAPVIPCYASENSLLRSRREFASNPLLQRRVFRRRRRRSAPILQNSLLFSLLAGNSRPETGSLETAPSASLTHSLHPVSCLLAKPEIAPLFRGFAGVAARSGLARPVNRASAPPIRRFISVGDFPGAT